MRKVVIFYGVVLALTAFILTWVDYKFWMRDIGLEVYGLVIAVLFAGLGLWIGLQGKTSVNEELNQSKILQDDHLQSLGLTTREMEMLEYLCKGKSNKEIARELDLSTNTIKTHLANLYQKLGVKNRTQAATKATRISLDPHST